MPTTSTPNSYDVTITDSVTGKVIGYPAHFVLDAAGSPVNPSTEDTLQQVLAVQHLLLASMNALLAVFQKPVAFDAGSC